MRKFRGGGRNSNVELLRLLCMFMILNLHSFWGYTHGEGVAQGIDFFRECACICAVDTFLIISGYFGIKWKLQSLFNLVFQIFFYAFAVYGVVTLLGVVDFSWRGLLHNAKSLYTYQSFITYYLLLYLCSPLLNTFVEKVTQKELLGFIIILIISELFVTKNYAFLNYCTMYLIGRYIAVSGVVNNRQLKAGQLYWLTTFVIFALVYASCKLLHIDNAATMQSLFWGLDYAAPLVILQAVFLFIWFARLNFQSRFINWCAASCFAIFLIHMHPKLKYTEIGYYSYTESLYSLSLFEHLWKLAILMFVVFFGSILIDKFRILISSVCYKVFLWIIAKLKIDKTNILSYVPNLVDNGRL